MMEQCCQWITTTFGCKPRKSSDDTIQNHVPFDSILDIQDDEIVWKLTTPYVPPVKRGRVIKVYDGDTITIATRLPYDQTVYRFSVRLLGIDCAEIKGKTAAEKECAVRARNALITKILGKTVVLKNVKLEKYGRILADVYVDDIHINAWMLEEGLAVPYDGGTKCIPSEWC